MSAGWYRQQSPAGHGVRKILRLLLSVVFLNLLIVSSPAESPLPEVLFPDNRDGVNDRGGVGSA